MRLSFECRSCGGELRVREEHVGRTVRCPFCQTVQAARQKAESPKSRVQPRAKALAIRGGRKGLLVLLGAGLLLLVAGAGGYLFFGAYTLREDRKTAANDLAQIGFALKNHEDVWRYLPPPAICDKEGKPLLSWRVAILPYLEEEPLYRQFHLDEPWDSPANKPLLEKVPRVYRPVRNKPTDPTATYYRLFVGPGAVYENYSSKPKFSQIKDGAESTLLVVEAGEAVPWTKPDELTYEPGKPLPKLGGMFGNGFYGLYCVGTPRFIPISTPETVLHGLITANGKELIPADLQAPTRFETGDY